MKDNIRSPVDKEFCKSMIIFESKEMKEVMNKADIAADNNVNTLIIGESGVGKELIAHYIHDNSCLRDGPFIAVNCSAVPETLFEGLFFDNEERSSSGAVNARKGYFEQANNGTLFLDKISEIPYEMQSKLLHVIEEKHNVYITGDKKIPANVKIITASDKSLQSLVQKGKFRPDLYYRLAIWVIRIPPLRERKEDIKALASYFLKKHCENKRSIDFNAMNKIHNYDWPGNIRELETCILRAILTNPQSEIIKAEDLQFDMIYDNKNNEEYDKIIGAFKEANGNILKATEILGYHRSTFYNKLKDFGISVKDFRSSNNGGNK